MKKVNVRPQLTSRLQLIKEGQPNPEELAPQENLKYQINDFLTTKRRKWQPKTLTTYTSILGLYMAQVGEDHWPPTRQGVLSWLDKVAETATKTTVHTYWIHVRSFLNYLEKAEVIAPTQNPVHQIYKLDLAPDQPDLSPIAFSPEELNNIFEHLISQAQIGSREAIRALALVRFAYVTGCRENEIAQLTLDHLKLWRYEAVILGETSKGKKQRSVYFDEETHQTLQNWLAVRPMVPGVQEVFVSLGGRLGAGHALQPRALYDILQRQLKAANITRRKFHALRHTSALDALDEGISLEKIQKQLGHASITTTMTYMRGRDEDRARAYRNQSLSAGLSKRADERRNQNF